MKSVASLGFALVLMALGFFSIFNVPVDSEALVLRFGEVHRKVGPGIQARIPVVERIVVEPVLRERQWRYDAPFRIQGCQAEVAVHYRIGDLRAYHAAKGVLSPLKDKRSQLEAALGTLPKLSGLAKTATPYAAQIADHLRSFSGPVEGGLHINRVNVALEEGCEPKRIVEEQRVAAMGTQPVGQLAPHRAAPGNLRAVTSDGVELQIENFAASYRIDDEARVEACFGGDRGLIAIRIGNLAERALSAVIRDIPFGQLAEAPARLHTALLDTDLDRCGVALGAVDFGKATVAKRLVINCEETSVEGCFSKPMTVRGLLALPRP